MQLTLYFGSVCQNVSNRFSDFNWEVSLRGLCDTVRVNNNYVMCIYIAYIYSRFVTRGQMCQTDQLQGAAPNTVLVIYSGTSVKGNSE